MTTNILEMSANLVTAHLSQSRMPAKEVPEFLRTIHQTFLELQNADSDFVSAPDPVAAAPAAAAPVANAEVPDAPAPAVEDADAEDAAAPTLKAESQEDDHPGSKIAYVRDNDLTNPVFKDLDPWLANRISPRIASKLDPKNEIHPSVFNDTIICLEDGQNVTLLRSYLRKRFNMTAPEYLEKWHLPEDFPMAPPVYLENKRALALKGGLGRSVRAHRNKAKTEAAAAPAPAKAPRGRPSNKAKAEAAAAAAEPVAATPAAPKRGRPRKVVAEAAKGTGARRTLSLFEKSKESQPA